MGKSVSQSSSTNSALQSLQPTNARAKETPKQLKTPHHIDHPRDAAQDHLTTNSLSSRASYLNRIKDGVNRAISTIGAAKVGLESIHKKIDQAHGFALTAQNTSDTTLRLDLAGRFNQIIQKIDRIASDSGFHGNNLIGSPADNLKFLFNEDGHSLSIEGMSSSSNELGISVRAFDSDTDILGAVTELLAAKSQINSNLKSLSSSSRDLQTRINFSESLANTLEQGAANVTPADLTEEAAGLLALHTRQAFGANSHTIATDNERAVLGLFS